MIGSKGNQQRLTLTLDFFLTCFPLPSRKLFQPHKINLKFVF